MSPKRAILDRHLPEHVAVRVFGSRASGARVKRFSDLDLALDGGEPLPLAAMATLATAFDESGLPFKVDLVDQHTVSAAFGGIVDRSSVAFPR